MYKIMSFFVVGVALNTAVQASLRPQEFDDEFLSTYCKTLAEMHETKNVASFHSAETGQQIVVINDPSKGWVMVHTCTRTNLISDHSLWPLYRKIRKIMKKDWSAGSWVRHEEDIRKTLQDSKNSDKSFVDALLNVYDELREGHLTPLPSSSDRPKP